MPSAIIIRGVEILGMDGTLSGTVDILIAEDTIAAIEADLPVEDAAEFDGAGHIAIPGLINAHTHAHNNLTKGLVDSWTLGDFRNRGSALFANRTADDQYLSAAIGAIEMLKTGCTAAYEQFVAVPVQTPEGIDAVMQAYTDVGIRALIAPAVADIPMYEAIPGLEDLLPPDLRKLAAAVTPAPAQHLLRLTEDAVRAWNGSACGRIRVATAPVIVGECTDELLRGCNQVARSYGVGLHTHLAETKVQALSSLQRFGKSLVSRLRDLEVLHPGLVAAHCIWVDDADIACLADHGAMIAHNPASNLKIGSGIAPVRELIAAGVTVGLGTDGSMASDNQNMFEAMRFAALVGKVRFGYEPDRWLSAAEVFDMATRSGAKLLGLDGQIGALEVGRKADIVLLRANSMFLRPRNNLRNSLVYAETATDVAKVFVGGRLVVDDGRVLTVDEEDIYARAQLAVDRLMRQNAPLLELAERLEPYVRAACAACAKSDFAINRYAN